MRILLASLVLALAAPAQHLSVATSASVRTVGARARVSLFVDVLPMPTIHVYAPGAKDYLPVALELNSSGVRAGKLTYPKPDDWYFEPTKEHVPVYQSPFRLTQEVVIASTAKPGTLIVTGVLKYQACDDTICYNPVTAPVSWTVSVK